MMHQYASGDAAYARQMISHHQDAVDMSNALLRRNPASKLAEFARKVVHVQRNEIEMLRAWLAKNK